MKAGLCCALLLLAASAVAQPSKAPVPPQFLQGDSLRIEEANLVIPSPGPGWNWQVLTPSKPAPGVMRTFMAVNPDVGGDYLVVVMRQDLAEIDEEYARGVLTGVRESAPDAAPSLKHDFVDAPLPHTLHYSFEHAFPNAGVLRTYAYSAATGKAVLIMLVTPAAQEPSAFTAFARSLRTIKPVTPKAPALPKVPSSMPGYFAILFVTAGIAALVNKATGRRIVGAFTCAAWLVGIVLVADVAFAIVLLGQRHITEFDRGYFFGGLFIDGIVPLTVAVVLAMYAGRNRTALPRAGA